MSTLAVAPDPEVLMDGAEEARRRFAVETAIGHLRGEGLHMSPFALQLQERFIAGEITDQQIIDELDKRYKRKC